MLQYHHYNVEDEITSLLDTSSALKAHRIHAKMKADVGRVATRNAARAAALSKTQRLQQLYMTPPEMKVTNPLTRNVFGADRHGRGSSALGGQAVEAEAVDDGTNKEIALAKQQAAAEAAEEIRAEAQTSVTAVDEAETKEVADTVAVGANEPIKSKEEKKTRAETS